MSGRYTFFVATGVPTAYISICTVAVFGTSYIRSTDPPSSITLDECQKVLNVNHVHSKHVISDILAIYLQQKPGAELSWVSIVNSSSDAVVTINAKGVPAGVYSLVLESVDKNSSLPTLVLKTDTVTIYKTEFVRSTSISSFLVIPKGNSVSLPVEKTKSLITLPNTSNVLLRQKAGTELYFVTVNNGPSSKASASVTINTKSQAYGTYSLVLESYDSANYPSETHQTDTVTIYVTEYFRSVEFESTITITEGKKL